MNIVYLALGSNQKFPERQIRRAIGFVKILPKTSITKISTLYWSKAWGVQSQQDFCNTVLEIETLLQPHALLKRCQLIEQTQGRVRKKHWGPRTIDIDIILYENRVIQAPDLVIPHPYFLERDFVLRPLLEINPVALCRYSQASRMLACK